jgi:hypothetical protein
VSFHMMDSQIRDNMFAGATLARRLFHLRWHPMPRTSVPTCGWSTNCTSAA